MLKVEGLNPGVVIYFLVEKFICKWKSPKKSASTQFTAHAHNLNFQSFQLESTSQAVLQGMLSLYSVYMQCQSPYMYAPAKK